MVIDSSLPCQAKSRDQLVDTQFPEKSGCKPFKWRSNEVLNISTGASDSCDHTKALTAARRKRSEIRRFRMQMAAVLEEDVDFGEPSQKRSRKAASPSLERKLQDEGALFSEVGTTSSCSRTGGSIMRDIEGDFRDDQESRNMRRRDSDGSKRAIKFPSHSVVSICGRSRVMEDAAIAVPSFLTMPSLQAVDSASGQTHNTRSETFHFFGVYDGHGGPQAAEFCKERMHGVLADEMSVAGDSLSGQWEACFRSCFGKLDTELCGFCPQYGPSTEFPSKLEDIMAGGSISSITAAPAILRGSMSGREPLVPGSVGTTALVAVVGAEHIVVGNCGDSRAVLSRDGGQAVPLSFDHKANRPDEVARIEAAGGHVFTWQGHRVCGVLATSRALGDGFLKPFVCGQPEVTVTARSDEDECLILASDGLWDALSNEFVCAVARKALASWRNQHTHLGQRVHKSVADLAAASNQLDVDAEDSPAQVVAALLTKLALAKHSKDNISVIVVDLKRV